MATNQPAAPYGWELATDANGNQRLVPKAPPTSGPSPYGDLISPAGFAALAKARAATALPASMAEHAGPANTNISSAASQAKVDQVAREAVADESATRAAAPSAAAPTAPAQSSPGFFSGLFKDPYAGMSPEQMNKTAHEMQGAGDEYGANLLGAGDEYGANLLTQRVDNAITSPDGSFAQGGSVDENHPVVQRAMHLVRSFLLNG